MFCGTLGHVMVPVFFYTLSTDCWLSFTATNARLAMLFTSKKDYMRESERERGRGEAGGVGGKGRVLRDRMSTGRSVICQIQCFSTEALTLRIITPGKPRDSPLNQVILLFCLTTKA